MQIFHCPPAPRVLELLIECNLPTSDIELRHFDNFLGCGTTEDTRGVVGLEIFGLVALLRSLAVAAEARGSGCGKALVEAAESYAKEQGVHEIYLLTTTAEHFFVCLGYFRVQRNTAPAQIKRTQEFSSLCSASAAVMVKQFAS